MEETTSTFPAPKRVKLSDDTLEPQAFDTTLPHGFNDCVSLLATNKHSPKPSIPASILSSGKTKNDMGKFQKLFDAHGFRTSFVSSPRSALSIYKDSCHIDSADDDETSEGKEYLLSMLGMSCNQASTERWYSNSVKNVYCLLLFCARVRDACPKAVEAQEVKALMEKYEMLCRSMAVKCNGPSSSPKNVAFSSAIEKVNALSSSVAEKIAELTTAVIKADPRIRIEQLEREYERITLQNSTYANAKVQLFLDAHDCCIKEIYFKRSHLPKFERITVYLYDPEIDLLKPPRFVFLPSLRRGLDDGPEALVKDMLDSFWRNLLRHGYFATDRIKTELTADLTKFFLSGIAPNPNIPLLLNAHFAPKYPLSFYVHGKAGAGKSSLVRNFSPAMNAAIEEHADPEILVRFVKQNLNKPFKDLQLELELRPNNNDLSVMSIIQGRRMTMTQNKPGLVVVDLEEMASNNEGANPNQLQTAQLISQRFSGRNGDFKEGVAAPRNSGKRGISGDASLLTLFTSNYVLEDPCVDALRRLEMFENLKSIEMTAVSGDDRIGFANTYIKQCISDHFANLNLNFTVELNIPLGSGDTRPLVRYLRMLGFFVCTLVAEDIRSSINVSIRHDETSQIITVTEGTQSIQLRHGSFDNLYPVRPRIFDERALNAVKELETKSGSSNGYSELAQIIDFYFAKTLAPAVVVSQNADLIKRVVRAIAAQNEVHLITSVKAGEYKMMKSLYDPNDTPNLRDDILHYGRGAFVAVELTCQTVDAQHCIREIIEDSPSMTAFSTNKSALYKSGIFFGVHVEGDITPEVSSRASLIL